MDSKALVLAILFCLVVSFCCYKNSNFEEDTGRKSEWNNSSAGVKYKPKDLFDLLNIIKGNQSGLDPEDIKRRLYDLEYNAEFEGVFKIYQTYSDSNQLKVSGGPVVDQKECGQQLDWILNMLDTANANRGPFGNELTLYLDSFGRLGSGAYSSDFDWLGSHDQCMATSLDKGNIKTRYCIARMQPIWWKNDRIKIRSAYRIGICLPETCDTLSSNHHKHLIERLIISVMADFYNQSFEFESMFCLPDERSTIRQLPASGWIYLIFVSTWLSLIIISTILYERSKVRHQEQESMKQYQSDTVQIDHPYLEYESVDRSLLDELIETLSIRVSLKKFVSSPLAIDYKQSEQVRVDLGFLSLLKVLMILIIVFGHSGWWVLNYTRSLAGRINLSISMTGTLSTFVGGRCVDTFLLIFGLLRAYTYMKKFNQQQIGNPLIWFKFVLFVLIRMIPTFMLVHWYIKSVSPYTGHGPWWDYGVDHYSSRGLCMQSSWWESIPILIDNVNFSTCVPPAWFLVVYLKIALILPALFYVLYRLPSHRSRIMFASFLVACSIAFSSIRLLQITSINPEGLVSYGALTIGLLTKFKETGYTSVWTRLGNVVIGCLIGLWLHQYEIGEIKQWPRLLRNATMMSIAIILNAAALLLPVFGNNLEQLIGSEASLTHFIVANAVLMLIWPILNSIIVIYFATVINHKVVVRFCSHPFWHVFNKLGLCIFLIHWEIIVVGFTIYEQGPPYGYIFEIYKTFSFVIVWCILLAIAIHILFEAPMSALLVKLVSTKISRDTVKFNSKYEQSNLRYGTKENPST